MKVFVVFALAVASALATDTDRQANTAYGYIQNVAIPLAEEIRKAEQAREGQRIIGGLLTPMGQIPYQAGLLANYEGVSGTGVCGGSLVTNNRVITAAHCWFDGFNQAYTTTVVLGSVNLFTGGERQTTNNVIMHPDWMPLRVRNDVAVIYLPNSVTYSNIIAPIALPSGTELSETFAGETGLASGFGITSDSSGISAQQSLSHVNLNIISNPVCFLSFPHHLRNSNICTSSVGNVTVCSGDSGGPLVVTRNNRQIMVGITSFGSGAGCEAGMPAVFARVSSFMSFFEQHMDAENLK